jgi:NTE family protein
MHIRSHWDLGDMLAFDTDRAKRNMSLGYQDALKAYQRLEGNSYAFYPGETRRNVIDLLTPIYRVRSRTGVSVFRDRERITRVQDMLCYQGSNSRFLPSKLSRRSFGCAVTTAAEITGELLGVPPDKTYTLPAFNRLLLESVARQEKGHSRAALTWLIQMLRAANYRGSVKPAFWRVAALFPAEFVAANYLMILENR